MAQFSDVLPPDWGPQGIQSQSICAAGARRLRMKVSYGFSYLFFQLCFKCSSLSKNHPNAFPLKLTLQGIEVSFPGNSGLDGSHSSNEPPWRRLGDVSILNPADWAMRSWVTFSLLSRVSSTSSSCHCCLRSCMTQSFLAHFLTHRFLISCEENAINISTFKKRC